MTLHLFKCSLLRSSTPDRPPEETEEGNFALVVFLLVFLGGGLYFIGGTLVKVSCPQMKRLASVYDVAAVVAAPNCMRSDDAVAHAECELGLLQQHSEVCDCTRTALY